MTDTAPPGRPPIAPGKPPAVPKSGQSVETRNTTKPNRAVMSLKGAAK